MAKVPEEWRDIDGFDGRYQVSSFGRVRNSSGHIMAFYKNKKGYLKVGLVKDGVCHKKRVNRLVALAFIENPQGLPQVDHLNGNKEDNRVQNLQWVDNATNDHLKKMRNNIVDSLPVLMSAAGMVGINVWNKMDDEERLALIIKVARETA